jgi:hypothetical protein
MKTLKPVTEKYNHNVWLSAALAEMTPEDRTAVIEKMQSDIETLKKMKMGQAGTSH